VKNKGSLKDRVSVKHYHLTIKTFTCMVNSKHILLSAEDVGCNCHEDDFSRVIQA